MFNVSLKLIWMLMARFSGRLWTKEVPQTRRKGGNKWLLLSAEDSRPKLGTEWMPALFVLRKVTAKSSLLSPADPNGRGTELNRLSAAQYLTTINTSYQSHCQARKTEMTRANRQSKLISWMSISIITKHRLEITVDVSIDCPSTTAGCWHCQFKSLSVTQLATSRSARVRDIANHSTNHWYSPVWLSCQHAHGDRWWSYRMEKQNTRVDVVVCFLNRQQTCPWAVSTTITPKSQGKVCAPVLCFDSRQKRKQGQSQQTARSQTQSAQS